MARKNSYIFTNKEHPQKGIMSSVLGVISAASVVLVLYFAYCNDGVAELRYGAALLLAALFSVAGFVLGILSKMESDKYYFFPYMGIIVNTIVLFGIGFILFAGVYGI